MLWFLCDSDCVKLICLVDDYGNDSNDNNDDDNNNDTGVQIYVFL